jgi:hypothetical protein
MLVFAVGASAKAAVASVGCNTELRRFPAPAMLKALSALLRLHLGV